MLHLLYISFDSNFIDVYHWGSINATTWLGIGAFKSQVITLTCVDKDSWRSMVS